MRLTEQDIAFISKNLELYGLKSLELKEDILDHICTHIENSEEDKFDKAYQAAIQQFGGYLNIKNIQRETNLQLYFKSAKNFNRLLFIIGYINTILFTTGILSKIMHWPYLGILLILGFATFIFITLPIYFYTEYRDKLLKY